MLWVIFFHHPPYDKNQNDPTTPVHPNPVPNINSIDYTRFEIQSQSTNPSYVYVEVYYYGNLLSPSGDYFSSFEDVEIYGSQMSWISTRSNELESKYSEYLLSSTLRSTRSICYHPPYDRNQNDPNNPVQPNPIPTVNSIPGVLVHWNSITIHISQLYLELYYYGKLLSPSGDYFSSFEDLEIYGSQVNVLN